jgi:hypothetical protein
MTGVSGLSYTDSTAANGTTYYYRVQAVNAAGTTASNVVSATPQQPAASSLVLQYRNNDSNATNNAVMPQFNIKNNGSAAVNLSGLKIRYYFTKDSSQTLNFWCDYAQIGSANVQGTFVTMSTPTSTADTYLEISLTSVAGTIAAGGQSGQIQGRFAKNDWSNFNETNDYSYDPTKTSFADWSKVTLYQNGTLVWGQEP